MNEYKNKNVLVLGMGKSGKSMAHFFHKRGAFVKGYDDKSKEDVFEDFCPIYHFITEVDISKFDILASSPGISFEHPLYKEAQDKNIKVIGEIEIGASSIKNRCIGITGTNGKSTTTSLIAHILNSANINAKAIGNIGVPITSIIDDLKDEILVIELSSYQIDQLKTPFLEMAFILNITPDHLDRYKTMENYTVSKLRIKNLLNDKGFFYLSKQVLVHAEHELKNTSPYFFDQPREEFNLFLNKFGEIEKKNYLAAICACEHFGLTKEQIIKGCSTFKGLEHRFEYVCDLNGVSFYNDSKATNIESVICAVNSVERPLIMLMGGEDKGLDYSILKAYFLKKVKDICLIGHVKTIMAKAFEKDFNVHLCDTLEMAVRKAYSIAKRKDVILLSPGTSSFDMFHNFEHRGESFKQIVKQLEGEKNESP